MPREIIGVRVSDQPYYEAAATFFSALAYPEDLASRRRFHVALCREAIISKCASDSGFAWEARVKPGYLADDKAAHDRNLRLGLNLIDDRMVAAEVIWRAAENERSGRARDYEGRKPTVSAMAGAMVPRVGKGQGTAGNIESRQWRPSKPVAHAAIAFRHQVFAHQRDGEPHMPVDFVRFDRPNALREMLIWAEQYRLVMGRLASAVPEAETIQFVSC